MRMLEEIWYMALKNALSTQTEQNKIQGAFK
jgi:hypothetical protein